MANQEIIRFGVLSVILTLGVLCVISALSTWTTTEQHSIAAVDSKFGEMYRHLLVPGSDSSPAPPADGSEQVNYVKDSWDCLWEARKNDGTTGYKPPVAVKITGGRNHFNIHVESTGEDLKDVHFIPTGQTYRSYVYNKDEQLIGQLSNLHLYR